MPSHITNFDDEGNLKDGEVKAAPSDPAPVMDDMTLASSAELAKEEAAVPPEVTVATPVVEPPPADMLEDMSKVAKAEAGLPTKEDTSRKIREEVVSRAKARKDARQERIGPFRVAAPPPPSVEEVMREMANSAPDPVAPGHDVEVKKEDLDRISDDGAEMEAVLRHKANAVQENLNRYCDTLNRTLDRLAQMVAQHEQKLHSIDGFLERSRT